MFSRRTILIRAGQAYAFAASAKAGKLYCQSDTTAGVSATAVTKVFGEGQKLFAVVLRYPSIVNGGKLTPATFKVEGRTIKRVYSSESALPGKPAPSGRYVVLELSRDDKDALLLVSPGGGGPAPGGPGRNGPGGPGSNGLGTLEGPGAPPQSGPGRAEGSNPADGGPPRGPRGGFPTPTLKKASASVVQLHPVAGVGGAAFPPFTSSVATTRTKNLIVDDFQQFTYTAPGGQTLRYNLFVPPDYDPAKKYPLVVFVHDAGTLSDNPLVTLAQGTGAVVWASPEDQAKRPCFVLAPQFSGIAEGEKTGPGSSMEMVRGLIESLRARYSIDGNRLYATGQSMGAMLSISMNIAYPDLFAASFLVAGQWDAQEAKPLAKDKLWIVVSQGDARAYPGENAMVAVWEAEGAHVGKAVWNGRATQEEFAADVAAMRAKDTPIHYVALLKGTVVPPDEQDNAIRNHLDTWRIAYGIEGIRAWLFEQHR